MSVYTNFFEPSADQSWYFLSWCVARMHSDLRSLMGSLYYWWLVITNGAYSLSRDLTSMIFFYKIFEVCANWKEPEPQFVISAPASGGYLISAPRLRLYNTGEMNRDPQFKICFRKTVGEWYRVCRLCKNLTKKFVMIGILSEPTWCDALPALHKKESLRNSSGEIFCFFNCFGNISFMDGTLQYVCVLRI